jgi:hypothetical protein
VSTIIVASRAAISAQLLGMSDIASAVMPVSPVVCLSDWPTEGFDRLPHKLQQQRPELLRHLVGRCAVAVRHSAPQIVSCIRHRVQYVELVAVLALHTGLPHRVRVGDIRNLVRVADVASRGAVLRPRPGAKPYDAVASHVKDVPREDPTADHGVYLVPWGHVASQAPVRLRVVAS